MQKIESMDKLEAERSTHEGVTPMECARCGRPAGFSAEVWALSNPPALMRVRLTCPNGHEWVIRNEDFMWKGREPIWRAHNE